ncbi:MAG: SUMF1/EgtB/PvdO family nonheme iron enzyme [Chloroflexota bacterium]
MNQPRTSPACRLGAAIVLAVSVVACGGAGPTSAPSAEASIAPSPVASDGQTAGEARVDAFGIDQVWVSAGAFRMGSDDAAIAALTAAGPPPWVASEFPSEVPAHEVRITKGYWIDTKEVTNAAFGAFVAAGGYTSEALWSDAGWTWLAAQGAKPLPLHCQGDVAEDPRMCITWYEAEAYAAWRAGRLPTEAEWEYAARGPESRVYPWGNDFDPDRANVINSTGPRPVGSYPNGASWVGAQDMAGNAMEWVSDWLGVDYYATKSTDDPAGPATGQVKVEKGGWWGSNQFVARSAYRHYEDPPTYGDKHIGFRVASQ